MKKRIMLNRKASKRLFKRTASHTHYKNIVGQPMRGGIRL